MKRSFSSMFNGKNIVVLFMVLLFIVFLPQMIVISIILGVAFIGYKFMREEKIIKKRRNDEER